MQSFPPYKEIDHPAMPKSRLNSLLIILMVTLFLSGAALIVLKQIDIYHRKQLYIATNAALPVHKTKLTKSDVEVKIFSSPELGFVQEYAEFYEPSEISANEAFPVLNYEKGPKGYQKGYRFASSLSSVFCPVLEVLVYSTEEKTAVNWLKVNADIKRAFDKQSTENINQIEFIKLWGPGGDMVPSEVYLALVNKNLYQLNLNFGLKGDSVDPKCGNILSGFKLTGSKSAEWKIYRNEEYGFSFEYPGNFLLAKDSTSDFSSFSFGPDAIGVEIINRKFDKNDIQNLGGIAENPQPIPVGSLTGYRYENGDGPWVSTEVGLGLGSKTLKIGFSSIINEGSSPYGAGTLYKDEATINKVLSSYKFTK